MTGALDVEPRWHQLVEGVLRLRLPRPCRVCAAGSRVRHRARRFSDLALDAGRPLALCDASVLDDAFEESGLPWRADIVDLATCSPAFRREVESHAVPSLDLPAVAVERHVPPGA